MAGGPSKNVHKRKYVDTQELENFREQLNDGKFHEIYIL